VVEVSLIVLVIAQDVRDPSLSAFDRTLRSALGPQARVELVHVAEDPPDQESVARSASLDGVVELSWAPDHASARLHCYVSRGERWVDREISFGGGAGDPLHEAAERGRLLGFAVATMFDESEAPERLRSAGSSNTATKPQRLARPPRATEVPRPERRAPARSLEFSGIMSSGIEGTASGLGASAGLRWQWLGPLALRGVVAGRAGNVPTAQATTATAQVGAGASWGFMPLASTYELGVRADALLSYFQATHLSEDDVVPDTKSRWLPGFDVLMEGGVRFAGSAGVFAGFGLEAMVGSTEIYTHGRRVAVVPPLRLVGELGFRTRF
jgi:hypothetical protein